MSLANATEHALNADSNLLIDESPYQFLPMLAQIYGDTCALILQQLHYISRKPFFHNERLLTIEHEGLLYVRIDGFMWWDSLEGFCRHLSKRTFERKKSELEGTGVLVIKKRLGRFRNGDNASWYAINYRVLKTHEGEFRTCFDAAIKSREEERAQVETETRGTGHWRPIPGDDTSRHFDAWQAPLSENDDARPLRQNDACLATVNSSVKMARLKRQSGANIKRQNGATVSDKMALSSLENRKEQEHKRKQQEQSAPEIFSETAEQSVVVVDSSNPSAAIAATTETERDENTAILSKLESEKVTPSVAKELIAKFGAKNCQAQLDCLSDRQPKGRAATLVKSIREAWSPPDAYFSRLEAAETAQRARTAQMNAEAAKEHKRGEEAQQSAQIEAENLHLDAMWTKLDPRTQTRIDDAIKDKLGVLGALGRGAAATTAFRREEMRKLLGMTSAPEDGVSQSQTESGG